MLGKHLKERVTLNHPRCMEPEDWLRFIETSGFTKSWKKLGLTDDDILATQMMIMVSPQGPPVVPGTNGLRKIRMSPPSVNVGKRQAFRVCYVFFERHSVAVLVAIYPKSRKDDLSCDEKKQIAELVKRFGECLDQSQ